MFKIKKINDEYHWYLYKMFKKHLNYIFMRCCRYKNYPCFCKEHKHLSNKLLEFMFELERCYSCGHQIKPLPNLTNLFFKISIYNFYKIKTLNYDKYK